VFMAATGVGVFVGAFNARSVLDRQRFATAYALGFLMLASGIVVIALMPPFALATALLVIAGAGNGLLLTANAMLVQQGARDDLRGRSFTLIMGANAIVLTIASIGAGVLADRMGARLVWALAGLAILIAGLAGWLLARPLSLSGERATIGVSLEPIAEPPLNV